jgi:hypothetical protein
MKIVSLTYKPTLMRAIVFFITFLISSHLVVSQNIDRVEVKGKIVVNTDDKFGITVFNKSSKQGSITDEKGEFSIKVALNDVIEFRALQFQTFTVIIDEDIMTSKKMTVYLVEQVNKLDEVIILPYDLTGNLLVDIESVKTFNPDMDAIYFGLSNLHVYEFSDDYRSKVVNIAMPERDLIHGINVKNLVGMFLEPLFNKSKKKKNKTIQETANTTVGGFQERYSTQFLVDNFKIPEDKIDEFIVYVETHGLDYSLLDKGKEFEFLDFISQKSVLFLESIGEKD